MNLDNLLLVAAALVLVLGVAIAWSGLHYEPQPPRQPSVLRVPIAVGAAAAGLVVALSGWIIPSVVVGAIVGWMANSIRRRQGAVDIGVERTEALASWVENVRDVLQSGNQPVGAIGATTDT
ncbi:MAG TPA: hypothetical protein VHQ23_08720, partial [Ilumatobacteraceae bacterium]|nr:hypothetical protein [Ilumatobacteraceae bacterium]